MAQRKRLVTVLGVIGIITLAGIAGNDDYNEEKLEEWRYCQMVYDGKWPDYKSNYNERCEADRLRPQFR